MKENKGTTILLTVIGVATLLVAVVGATFAFFTATVSDQNTNQTNVTVTAATLGTITFTHGNTITLNPAYPGATGNVDFTVAADAASTVPVDYDVYLVTTTNSVASGRSETNNLVGTLTGGPTGATINLTNTPLTTTNFAASSEVLIGSGTLQPTTTDTWNLAVTLVETGAEQNNDQGRAYTGYLKVVASTQYTQGQNGAAVYVAPQQNPAS